LAENVNSNGLYVAEDVMVSFSGKDVFEGAIVEVGAGEEVQDVIRRVRRMVRINRGFMLFSIMEKPSFLITST
jgi:hypothetical protein